jgi:cellulose synthase/poly-beta-1,6-N-acetylglucosamine synthase-like glycosyltransferase
MSAGLVALLASVVAACWLLVVYSYILYPIALIGVAAVAQARTDLKYVLGKSDRRRRDGPPGDWPSVAVVIAAFNEETHLQARIDNLLALDYPADRLRCYIGSDGSSDRTNAILRQVTDPRVCAVVFEQNRGKASVLNDLVGRAREDIVAFSDANTFYHRDALKRLVPHFDDPSVGGVSGELRLIHAGGDNQDSLYWRIEQMLKFFESRIGGLLGANGAIYALRRQLWRPMPADTICDDFHAAMQVAATGHRLVYEPNAWAEEETPADIGDEYDRRVRIGIGNFQQLLRYPQYLSRTSWGTRFAYLSHKVLRWVAPHLLIVAMLCSAALAVGSTGWLVFLLVQLLGLGGSAWLYQRSTQGASLGKLAKILAFLFALNWAFLVASWRYAKGDYRGSWRRTAR